MTENMKNIIAFPFGEDFIENLAELLFKEYESGRDLRKIALVFGGKRPALFLKKSLSKKIKKSFWPPHFFSMDEFIDDCLLKGEDFSAPNELEITHLIYTLAKKNYPRLVKNYDFPGFLSWAREIKGFIEQLDLEDVEEEALQNISSSTRISAEAPAAVQKLLENIAGLRADYHRILKEKKTYPRGWRYLLASEYIEKLNFEEFEEIFFCNLFFLHKTEIKIIQTLFQKEKARLVFQGGAKDWPILNELAGELGIEIQAQETSSPKPVINFYSGPDLHHQVTAVREILKTLKEKEKTLIVLPQAESLVPLLSEISAFARDYNVSLGYPLKRSALATLLKNIFEAQLTRKNNLYYSKDYLKLLSHPFIKNLKSGKNPGSATATRILIHKIEEIILGMEKTTAGSNFSGALFINPAELENFPELFELAGRLLKNFGTEASFEDLKIILSRIHELFFKSWETVANFKNLAGVLEKIIAELLEGSFLEIYPINLSVAQRILNFCEEIKLVSFSSEKFPLEGIFKITSEILEGEVISFSGSPLKGLQILGFLETRALNFKNVIFLDLNEAVLPRLKIYEPLIPREIMFNLGLASLEKEEESQRYNFYRLISSAEKVFLIYEESDKKEKSRLVEELMWQEQQKNRTLTSVAAKKINFPVVTSPALKEISKSPSMIKFLKEKFTYSASSLDTYLNCPERFYFQYVLGLREKEVLSEEAETSDIGIFVHGLLKETFSQFISQKPVINDEFEKLFFEMLEEKFSRTFEKTMKSDSFMLKEVLKFRLGKFLEAEKERPVQKILALEEIKEQKIKFSGTEFKFKTIIDRLDQLEDGSYLIIDYKTGETSKHKPKNLARLENFETRAELKSHLKSVQLPLYFYFWQKDFSSLNAALYGLKNSELEPLFKKETPALRQELISQPFLKALEFIISEIIDPEKKFAPDLESEYYCENCPFGQMCR